MNCDHLSTWIEALMKRVPSAISGWSRVATGRAVGGAVIRRIVNAMVWSALLGGPGLAVAQPWTYSGTGTWAPPASYLLSRGNLEVPMDAKAYENPARIELRFFQSGTFKIYRKSPFANSWGSPITTFTSETIPSVWTDTNVVPGVVYEYGVGWETTNNADMFGNVIAGIKVDQTGPKGRFAVVVAEDVIQQLPEEYAQYKQDLVADGWTVHEIVTPRAADYLNQSSGTRALASVSVTSGGTGYTTGQQVELRSATSVALGQLVVNSSGVITSVTVTYGNSGFTVGEALTMTRHTTGTGAVLTVGTVVTGTPEHINIRNQLIALNNRYPGELKNVVLLGKVAVPRSGVGYVGPDGHGNRAAVGADAYYADMDGVWTDTSDNLAGYPVGSTRTAALSEGRINLPGDNKFDATYFSEITNPNSRLELGFGRVDMSNNVPGEYDALRMYFNKLHRYKVAASDFQPGRRVLHRVDGPPTGSTVQTVMLRNMPGVVGMENIHLIRNTELASVPSESNALLPEDMDSAYTKVNGPYLFALKGSGGPTRSTGGKAVFWTGLQSHWGYWFLFTTSFTNSMQLRLGEDNMTLSYTWSIWGTDYLYFRMGLGYDMGDVMRVSMSERTRNTYLYTPTSSAGGLFMNHMGCPSLRLFMFEPPADLKVLPSAGGAQLSWTASPATGVIGYHVYRSNQANGPFQRLTSSPVAATSYQDAGTLTGDWHYQVKAVRLETTGGGTFYNTSLAAQQALNLTSGSGTLGILTTGLPEPAWNMAYQARLKAEKGTPPYRWSVVSGALPAGMSLDASGQISGTPTREGDSAFTVAVEDQLGQSAQRTFHLRVSPDRSTVILAEAAQWASNLSLGRATDATLQVSGTTFFAQTFLRFNLAGLNTDNRFVRARLLLNVDERSQPNSYALLRAALTQDAADSWNETALTYATRPADNSSTPIASANQFPVPFQTVELDVTDLVKETLANDPAKKLGLRIFTTLGSGWGNDVRIINRYGLPSVAPRLILETTDAPQIRITSPASNPSAIHGGSSVMIDGTVTSIPGRAAPTVQWSQLSGPGTVVFGSQNQVATTAAFSKPGDYVLRITANDGVLSSRQDLMVRVLSIPNATAPVVGPADDSLLLRLAFDEGSGSNSADWSGNLTVTNGALATIGANGLPSWIANGKIGGAMNFDGSGQRVEVEDLSAKPLDGMQKFTASLWIKLNAEDGSPHAILVKRTTSNAATTSYAITLTNTERISVSVANRTAITGDNILAVGEWYHVAMVYDGSLGTNNLKLYLNGNPEKFGTISTGVANNAIPRILGSKLRIGDFTATAVSAPFNGQADEVRIYNRALTLQEIQDLAQAVPANVGPRISLSHTLVTGTAGQAVSLNATVTDDGLPQPLDVKWTKSSGAGSVVFSNPISSDTAATTSTPGAYGLRITASDGSITTFADVAASIEGAPGLASWRQTHFGTTENSGDAADDADPMKDGLRNLMKYALGLNPWVNYSNSPMAPRGNVENVSGQDYLTYTFTRDTSVSDAVIEVEVTSDLAASSWTSLDLLQSTHQVRMIDNTPEAGMQTITVRDVQPLSQGARRFMRLKVSQRPAGPN